MQQGVPNVPSSRFDLSHDMKFTLNMAELVPCCFMEAMPGDTFSLSHVHMLRMMPMVAPIMHKVRVRTEYFFVPNRILFPGWEDFITGQQVIEHPYITLNSVLDLGTNADYIGIPPGDYSGDPIDISAFPIAALVKIYNDWYRAQQFISEVPFELQAGGSNAALYDYLNGPPFKRAWRHDYFTSALPDPQQGDPVSLPLVDQQNIPVEWDLDNLSAQQAYDPAIGTPLLNNSAASTNAGGFIQFTSPATSVFALDPNNYFVDVQAEAATIDDLRQAWLLQQFLERTMRGGARYFEQLKSHFDVDSPDARLQMPELLYVDQQTMTISEVLSTAQTTSDDVITPVGQMAGHGISVGGAKGTTYTCQEHGFIIGIVSVIPDTAYQDGMPRFIGQRKDRFDYPWPDLAALGEQAILNQELLCHDLGAAPFPLDGVWGYVPRYSEMRYQPDRVAGDFRDTLAFWTLVRQFNGDTPPALNAQFITADPDTRIFAVQETPFKHIVCQTINKHSVNRKLPRYGIPATIG